MRNQSMSMLRALQHIEEGGPAKFDAGICINIERVLGRRLSEEEEEAFDEAIKSWPHFNGRVTYPVGDGSGEYFNYATNDKNMWDEEDDYGALRWDLLRHLIRELGK